MKCNCLRNTAERLYVITSVYYYVHGRFARFSRGSVHLSIHVTCLRAGRHTARPSFSRLFARNLQRAAFSVLRLTFRLLSSLCSTFIKSSRVLFVNSKKEKKKRKKCKCCNNRLSDRSLETRIQSGERSSDVFAAFSLGNSRKGHLILQTFSFSFFFFFSFFFDREKGSFVGTNVRRMTHQIILENHKTVRTIFKS